MDEQPFPLPRATRETEILNGDGGQTYGPFAFKVFDAADLRVSVRHDGGDWQGVSFTAAKVAGLEFDDFTITFTAPLPATSDYIVRSARLHERQVAVTKGGAIGGRPLEKELSKQGSVIEELRRDIDRGGSSVPGLPGQTLMFGADGRVWPGINQSDIANVQVYADEAQAHANDALGYANVAQGFAGNAASSATEAQMYADIVGASVYDFNVDSDPLTPGYDWND